MSEYSTRNGLEPLGEEIPFREPPVPKKGKMYPMVVAIGYGGAFALGVHECLDHDWLFFDSTRDLDECPIDFGSFELDPGVYLMHVELVTVLSLDEGWLRVPEPELQVREIETLLAHESISSVIDKDPVEIKG